MRKLNFIDLFAGCGGLSEGFIQTNYYKGITHIEWEKAMVDTLRNRLVKKWGYSNEKSIKSVIHFDLQNTNELIYGNWSQKNKQKYQDSNHIEIMNHGLNSISKQNIDLVIGGPPCQAYSIAGRAQDQHSMKNDYRNYLFESFATLVKYYSPKLFVFENVPGILSAKPGGILVTKRIYDEFKKIGYNIKPPNELKNCIYSSADFEVAQKRRRVILIGVKVDGNINLNDIYKSINKEIKKKKVTIKDVIGNLPKPNLNSNIKHHTPRFHNSRDISIFKEWINKKMNNLTIKQKINYYNQKTGKNSNHAKYRNLEWNKLSPTIVAHLYKDGLMFIHPDPNQARSITVKEAALLQSFPDDFEFIGSQGHCYKMIGNAVPVKMAKGIAHGVYNILKKTL